MGRSRLPGPLLGLILASQGYLLKLFGYLFEAPLEKGEHLDFALVFKDFAKENESFEIKALSVGGKVLPPDQIDVLAKLPTRDQAISILMSVMQAPITKLAQALNDVPGRVTRLVAAVRDQKQQEGE